jgi:hypothetical protein
MTLAAPMPRWRGALEPLWWVARALRKEVLDFRFEYPVETVPSAGPRESLRYHVYSDRLFFDAMALDPQGIPVQHSRVFGAAYNPAYVAWYGLTSLERSLRGIDPAGSAAFLRQADWLVRHAVRRDDGAVVWPYTFDHREGRCRLEAPWICAMAQGLAISVLVRAHRIAGGGEHLLELCRAATLVFEKSVEDGGVRTLENGHALYEEYPGYPLPRVLDGFLFSLLGLWDLAVQTGEERVHHLFADGIAGLRRALDFWDYRGRWSWYGSHGYLCPPQYNVLNAALLEALGAVSGEPALREQAERWHPRHRGLLARVEVFLVFVVTKNLSRFRHRTWRR